MRRLSRPAALLVSLALFEALPARADAILDPSAPHLTLELETQFAQPNGPSSRGVGLAAWASYKFTDQLSLTGTLSTLESSNGPWSTAGLGVRAMLDLLPLTPFVDLQLIAIGPDYITGYSLATRVGGGVDWQMSPGFAVGLAVRTLTPFNGTITVSQGIEVGMRFALTPALFK